MRMRSQSRKAAPVMTSVIAALCMAVGTTSIAAATIPIVDGSLYYRVGGNGAAILLLNGGPGRSGDYLEPVFDHLATSYRVILPDQRGTGRSQLRTLDANSVTVHKTVADLEVLRASLGIKHWTIVGHSWGGMLAMAYAVAHRDSIRSLVLVGSGGTSLEFFNRSDVALRQRQTTDEINSQIGAYSFLPLDVQLKTGLHLPDFLATIGVKDLDAYARDNESWLEKLYDGALQIPAMIAAQGRCTDATCHRITFMYASLYKHEQLNDLTHTNMHELFGIANMRSFQHIAKIGRSEHSVDFADRSYLTEENWRHLNLPIAFIHGAENHCFLPKGTEMTFAELTRRFAPDQYSRTVIPGYGHIDCIFGKNAVNDVYPHILAHLETTA